MDAVEQAFGGRLGMAMARDKRKRGVDFIAILVRVPQIHASTSYSGGTIGRVRGVSVIVQETFPKCYRAAEQTPH